MKTASEILDQQKGTWYENEVAIVTYSDAVRAMEEYASSLLSEKDKEVEYLQKELDIANEDRDMFNKKYLSEHNENIAANEVMTKQREEIEALKELVIGRTKGWQDSASKKDKEIEELKGKVEYYITKTTQLVNENEKLNYTETDKDNEISDLKSQLSQRAEKKIDKGFLIEILQMYKDNEQSLENVLQAINEYKISPTPSTERKPVLVEKYGDNGGHSHWEVLDKDGLVIWNSSCDATETTTPSNKEAIELLDKIKQLDKYLTNECPLLVKKNDIIDKMIKLNLI